MKFDSGGMAINRTNSDQQDVRESIYFAADLGASSGRVMVAYVTPTSLRIEEIYRFENQPIKLQGELFWDIPSLLDRLKYGLQLAYHTAPGVRSLAIDTWGTDFGLIDEKGQLVISPYSYREFVDNDMVDLVRRTIPDEELYALTGIQFIQVNSLYQLVALKARHPTALASARWLLMLPDLLNYCLTGVVQAEYTVASTTHFLSPVTRTWERRIFDRLKLPTGLLPTLVQPGSKAGHLLPSVAKALAIPELEVKSCASHDTASAVAAVPALGAKPWAFISCGTWLLVGVETQRPYLHRAALAANVTNEAGVDGSIRLLKNLTGLWLVQRLRRDFQALGQEYSFEALEEAGRSAQAFRSLIYPNAACFHNPENMPEAIAAFCTQTGQPVPQTPGEFARCAFESLACACAEVIRTLADLTGQKIEQVHVIGGGAQNQFLNECIANACNCDVLAGPVEATAIGNAAIQAISDGIYGHLAAARRTIAVSFSPQVYHPSHNDQWQQHLEFYRNLEQIKT